MQNNMLQSNFITKLGGIFFILSAITQIVALFGPPLSGEIEFLDLINDRPGYTLFFTLAVLAFTLFNVPAFLSLTHKVGGRGKWLTYIGSTMALIGNFFFSVLVTEALFYRGMATLEREPMAALMQWTFDTPIYFLPHLLSILIFYIGLILLTIGLFRAGVTSFWLIIVGVVQIIAGILDLGPAQEYVQGVVIFALFGGLGWILLRKPQQQSLSIDKTNISAD